MTVRGSASFGTSGSFDSVTTNTINSTVVTRTTSSALGNTSNTYLVDATAGAVVISIPAASTLIGRVFVIKKIDASVNTVTIDPNGAETIDGAATKVLSTQWSSVMIQCNGTAWFILSSF